MSIMDVRLGVSPDGTLTKNTVKEKISDDERNRVVFVPTINIDKFENELKKRVINAFNAIDLSGTPYSDNVKAWVRDRIADGSIEDLIKVDVNRNYKDVNQAVKIHIEEDFAEKAQEFADRWMEDNGYKEKGTWSKFTGFFSSKPVEFDHKLYNMIKKDDVLAHSSFEQEVAKFRADQLKKQDEAKKKNHEMIKNAVEGNKIKAELKKLEDLNEADKKTVHDDSEDSVN